jgi:hypothetical protein
VAPEVANAWRGRGDCKRCISTRDCANCASIQGGSKVYKARGGRGEDQGGAVRIAIKMCYSLSFFLFKKIYTQGNQLRVKTSIERNQLHCLSSGKMSLDPAACGTGEPSVVEAVLCPASSRSGTSSAPLLHFPTPPHHNPTLLNQAARKQRRRAPSLPRIHVIPNSALSHPTLWTPSKTRRARGLLPQKILLKTQISIIPSRR